MRGSTHTLELDPAVAWRLVGVPRARQLRRQAPATVGRVEAVPAKASAADERIRALPRRGRIRPGDDATEFAFFVATLAAIGLLHVGVFALLL